MTSSGKTISTYMNLRAVIKRVLPDRLVSWLRKAARRRTRPNQYTDASRSVAGRPQPTVDHLLGLEIRLWSTRNSHYADRLALTLQSMSEGSEAYARGAIALARWLFFQGRFDDALRRLERVHSSDPELDVELALLRVDCLCQLRRPSEALGILSTIVGRGTTDPNLVLRVGYARSLVGEAIGHGSGAMSEALNSVYASAGFGLIRRTSPTSPLSLDNISCDVPTAEPQESLPLVSIITRGGESLSESLVGLSSLVSQSWKPLEILVPAAGSERDELAASVPSLVDDDRIVFFDKDDGVKGEDSLATATSRATGELITFHDLGSWAHPQRVEAQAAALLADPALNGNLSCCARVNWDLDLLTLGVSSSEHLVGPDPDTMMVRASGTPSDAILEAFNRVQSLYAPVTGAMTLPDGMALVSIGVPLNLSTTRRDPASSTGEAA